MDLIKNGDIPASDMLVYRRVSPLDQQLGEYWGITGNYFNPIIGLTKKWGFLFPAL